VQGAYLFYDILKRIIQHVICNYFYNDPIALRFNIEI